MRKNITKFHSPTKRKVYSCIAISNIAIYILLVFIMFIAFSVMYYVYRADQ